MITIDFENINNKWYVICDDYTDDLEDLVIEGDASLYIEEIHLADACFGNADYDDTVSFEVYDEEPSIGTYGILRLIDHDDNGGTYQGEDNNGEKLAVRLNNIIISLFFNGEYPQTIYFNPKFK